MLAKRIIPCLDIKDGKTVKGINFAELKNAGDPVELAMRYCQDGADELVFLDITATIEKRNTFTDLVKEIAAHINIPFTVGGGINTLNDVDRMLSAGADKISVNSSALKNPSLLNDIAQHFGSQVCVCAIDARLENNQWICYSAGGCNRTEKKLFDWAKQAEERGAGEILFTSMDHDGVKQGFANDALSKLNKQLNIPIIASGGAGEKKDFKDVFLEGKADAALAASIFHFNEITISDLKKYLQLEGIIIRK